MRLQLVLVALVEQVMTLQMEFKEAIRYSRQLHQQVADMVLVEPQYHRLHQTVDQVDQVAAADMLVLVARGTLLQ
jgi:hypothetical protein